MPRPRDTGEPERRCIVTGARCDPSHLLRFVAGPDGMVVPDLDNDLPGRGLWVSAQRAKVAEAVRRGAFSRAARQRLQPAQDLPDMVAGLLRRRALSRLGLAQRGGAAVTGADKVRDWITRGRAGLLLQAHDGAADGRRRLAHLAQAMPLVALYGGPELSLALGRENVVHAAIAAGGAADRILQDARRLLSYEGQGDDGATLLAGTGTGIRMPGNGQGGFRDGPQPQDGPQLQDSPHGGDGPPDGATAGAGPSKRK